MRAGLEPTQIVTKPLYRSHSEPTLRLAILDRTLDEGAVGMSLYRAAEATGIDAGVFDISYEASVGIAGWRGRLVRHLDWERLAARRDGQLLEDLAAFRPSVIVVIKGEWLSPASLLHLRQAFSAKVVLWYPDTLHNLTTPAIATMPLYDHAFFHCRAAAIAAHRLRPGPTNWLPLGWDPLLHPFMESRSAEYEVLFVGGYRPRREEVLARLVRQFDVDIFGPGWTRASRPVRKTWHKARVAGRRFSELTSRAAINLNIIDPFNFPGVNMRFFEIPGAGGFQLVSNFPEARRLGGHGRMGFFSSEDDVVAKARHFLSRNDDRTAAQIAGHEWAVAHTYEARLQRMLMLLRRSGLCL